MILSNEFIRLFMKIGLIGIEPFNAEQLNPNSYDVRLDEHFYDLTWHGGGFSYGYSHEAHGQHVSIPINGTLLGKTIEKVDTRFCVTAQLRSKSSTRRVGITVCDDAGLGDIGYCNHWTVELSAKTGDYKPFLVVGERFAQVVFYLTTPTLKPYSGQYVANDWPENMIPSRYR